MKVTIGWVKMSVVLFSAGIFPRKDNKLKPRVKKEALSLFQHLSVLINILQQFIKHTY